MELPMIFEICNIIFEIIKEKRRNRYSYISLLDRTTGIVIDNIKCKVLDTLTGCNLVLTPIGYLKVYMYIVNRWNNNG